MFVPLWLVWMVLVLLVVFAGLAARRGAGGTDSMIDRQRRETPIASSDQLEVLASPEVRAALERGDKIGAIRLVRERTGLGLREAKDLIERHGR